MRSAFFILICVFAAFISAGRTIDVRLFSTDRLAEAWVSASAGSYALIALNEKGEQLDTVAALNTELKEVLHINVSGKELNAQLAKASFGGFSGMILVPMAAQTSFIVKGKGRERIYRGSLIYRLNGNELTLINRVDLEDYVAGVVESEGGHVDSYEYFKAQAVLARTWVLRNLQKHKKEGYHVKDDVSSQAYYSMAYLQNSKAIMKAVYETRDTILIDNTGDIVFGAFHANSGGETVNSEEVWQGSISYLRSVSDTFSLAGEKAFWEKSIDKEKFIGFFARKLGQNASDTAFRAAVLAIHQQTRMPFFTYKGKKLKMRWVRENFGLRSTFFNVLDQGKTVLLKGKGFGHGIGMSQEGAMRMAELGFDYKAILSHYFSGVRYSTATALLP